MTDTVKLMPHQWSAFNSKKRIILLCGGIQGGKSFTGAHWLRDKIHTYTDKDDTFIITAPTYKMLNQSTLPAFLKVFKDIGEYKKGDQEFHIISGAKIYLRTATDPWSIEGMTNVRGIWCDEAGRYPLLFWDNIQGRAAFKQCQILITTTPYAMNWLSKMHQEIKQGKRHDVHYVPFKSIHSKYFPQEEYERQKALLDPRMFRLKYEGSFERMAGLVYDCFQDHHQTQSTRLDRGTKYYAGIDMGYTAPFALSIRAITPDNYHFTIDEHYQTGLITQDKIDVCKAKAAIYNIEMFFCDPEDPAFIEELNRAGLKAVAHSYEKGKRWGIDQHYQLIKSGRWHIFEDQCPNAIDEYNTYHYPEEDELKYNQDQKEQLPVKANDHLMDAEMYVTVGTLSQHKKHTPHVPGRSKEYRDYGIERVERLNRQRKRIVYND